MLQDLIKIIGRIYQLEIGAEKYIVTRADTLKVYFFLEQLLVITLVI
jgi:hypothetical protein